LSIKRASATAPSPPNSNWNRFVSLFCFSRFRHRVCFLHALHIFYANAAQALIYQYAPIYTGGAGHSFEQVLAPCKYIKGILGANISAEIAFCRYDAPLLVQPLTLPFQSYVFEEQL
jgi:hypothetical protein